MTPLKAILWDVDGTLAETERDGHLVAFNLAFESHGLPWRWDDARYARLLRVTGGRERLLHDMFDRSDAPRIQAERAALAAALHRAKNAFYAQLVHDGAVPLRPGVAGLMAECEARGIAMAIATTTSRSNVVALLQSTMGTGWHARFAAIVCGEDVARKKPDPEVFQCVLSQLDIAPLQAVAIEDSPGGAAAARAAGVPVVVTRSLFFADAAIDEAIAIGPGLDRRAGWHPAALAGNVQGSVGLDDILGWRHRMALVSEL